MHFDNKKADELNRSSAFLLRFTLTKWEDYCGLVL